MQTQIQARIKHWLSLDSDAKSRDEIQALVDQGAQEELAARFAGRLTFGTAGIRGVVGAGPMRMNRLVVQQTSKGVAEYLKAQVENAASRGVIIGYDGRHDSKQFAEDAASVLTAAGFKVFLTSKVAPTPLVAFCVLHLGAAAGIVVTASHNPPQYNGYKVYWGNGAQIIPPHDTGIAARIELAANSPVDMLPLDVAIESGKLVMLEADYYQAYRQGVLEAEVLQNHTRPELVSLAYTAMHGVGAEMAETLLKDIGVTQVYSVAAQREPDGDFPTVNFPNPEEAGAMDLVMAEAHKQGAMLACANDPDADRFAVAVRRPDATPAMPASQAYQMLTGDQVGVLLGHYLLSHAGDDQRLLCCTIVSSSLLTRISETSGARCETTLTGFKWLTNVGMSKQTQENRFLFAYEEALGYTVGSMVWDKDGLSALVAFVQLTAELAAKGETLWDRLESIYRQFGYYLNRQVSIALSGEPGAPTIGEQLRALSPSEIAGRALVSVDDISLGLRRFADGREEAIDLPRSDVLIYRLEGNARVIVRPSGTEPKVKCYYEVVEAFGEDEGMDAVQRRAEATMEDFVSRHQAGLPKA
ncbi:phospho-sugar mutase [Shewanella sp. Isolate7]|uniref:phospho-sugar mutase n=1 Tax=Shewanella sp. Isolate7 TaxID=2908528 RepID=UPI001EFEE03E|nr:phospho-sugar mutase [Shewanella sp. Isolate7]MCG9720929.1 phospho-sugar mutase [Shewanella sp. Isolate7]